VTPDALDRLERAPAPERHAADSATWLVHWRGLVERSAHVRRRLADAGLNADDLDDLAALSRLPPCAKADLRRGQEAAPPFGDHLAVAPDRVALVYQTSGTTGRPTLLALTAADADRWRAIGARTYRMAGIDESSRVLAPFGAGPFTIGHAHSTIDHLGARRVPVGAGDTERAVDALVAGLVDTLLCTASFAVHLASALPARGIDPAALGLRRVVTGGEPGGGLPEVRRSLRSAFDAEVVEVMGIGDVAPSLWGECEQADGMHLGGVGLVHVELIDPRHATSLAWDTGAVGELVYTHLQREAMPLVRFRSGDVVEVLGTACACGRTTPRIRVLGRSDDMFIVRGVNVFPTAVQDVVASFGPPLTGRCRVILPVGAVSVEPPVPVEVEVDDIDGTDDAARVVLGDRLAELVRARLSFRAAVSVVPGRDFEPPGYKSALIVRR
jgi:phenylacetate-CoA ligase